MADHDRPTAEHDALDRHWETPVDRAGDFLLPEVDPGLARAIVTFRRLADRDAARPDPAFVHRLLEEMMAAAAPVDARPPAAADRSPSRQPLAAPVLPGGAGVRWRPTTGVLATAALVLLTVVLGLRVLGGRRPDARSAAPRIVPAVVATPAAGPGPVLPGGTVVFDQRLDRLPDGAHWVGIERWTLGVGAVWAQGDRETTTGIGTMVYRVESGVATLVGDGDVFVTPAGAAAGTLPAGSVATLRAGDTAFAPTGVRFEWRNEGRSPLTILAAGVADELGPMCLPSGVERVAASVDLFPIELPAAPLRLTGQSVTLAPGGAVAPRPVAGRQLLGVTAGTLEVVWADGASPARRSVATGQQVGINGEGPNGDVVGYSTGSGNSKLAGAPFVASQLRNDGEAPATFYLLTLAQDGSMASPVAVAGPPGS